MEDIKAYLLLMGKKIKLDIDEREDDEDDQEIVEACEEFNEVYKFYCHYCHLKCGADPREHEHEAAAAILSGARV